MWIVTTSSAQGPTSKMAEQPWRTYKLLGPWAEARSQKFKLMNHIMNCRNLSCGQQKSWMTLVWNMTGWLKGTRPSWEKCMNAMEVRQFVPNVMKGNLTILCAWYFMYCIHTMSIRGYNYFFQKELSGYYSRAVINRNLVKIHNMYVILFNLLK